jgi:Fe2+ transport system protein FeoA
MRVQQGAVLNIKKKRILGDPCQKKIQKAMILKT